MEPRSHARTRGLELLVVIVAIAALGACSESGGKATPRPGTQGVPEATLGPPSSSMPPGVSALCASVTRSTVAKIVGPLRGAVPESEYQGTLFAAVLGASLNDCRSHKEWLDGAESAAGGYRKLLDDVYSHACAVAKGQTTTGGSGGGTRPAPLPASCRNGSAPSTTAGSAARAVP